jgi:hypothetical protein
MNSIENNRIAPTQESLEQQRLLLREQLATQRQVLVLKLGPVPTERTQWAPRSNTMRFFIQRPELLKKLLGQIAGLAIGASFIKSMHPLLAITKFLHSSFSSRR